MPKAILVVGTNATGPEHDAEFNDWYTNVHLDDVVAVDGFARAKRYSLSDVRPVGTYPASGYRYLAIYEVDTDDLEAVGANLQAALDEGRMPLSDALDGERLAVDFYIPIEGAERP